MTTSDEILVFDTSPLRIFPRQNLLGVLKAVVGDRRALVPDVVVHELQTEASGVVDDFLSDLYRLPFKQGEFEVWAVANNLLD